MPNITIYLTDEEYFKFIHLGDEEQQQLRDKFKNSLLKKR